MPRLLNFDEEGFYIFGADVHNVPEGTPTNENQYLAGDDETTPFNRPKLVDGKIVEGLTPEELDELNKPVEQEPSPEERIAQLEQENKLLKAQNNALTERTDFHEEVLTEIILTITP